MRLFVAVEVTASVIEAAGALIAELRTEAARRDPGARVSWLGASHLHLTVAFIGNVDDGRLDAIQQSLRPPYAAAPFNIHFRGVGVFPERGRPRVVWAGIETGREQLVALARDVGRRLLDVGVALEERAYHPHLTLGRVREAGRLRASMLTGGREQVVLGATRVGAITLFESRLSPAGPSYRAIERIALCTHQS